jgi:RHS repeat-associated protein
VDLSVIRDTTPPTLTLEAVVQRDVLVAWNVKDSGSGVDASTCLLEVREDEGAWQTFSTQCRGEDATHDGQPVHTYTFRLSARDNVSNAASTEVEAVVPYVKKYYYANGQRVAMQKEGVVYYVHTDHLGSTSLTTCGSQDGCDGTPYQGVVARQLYHPYGSPRWSQGTLPTDYTFTGQRLEAGLGLMHYGARFYSPRLGRFVSADTIVPQPGEPQAAQWPLRVGTFKPQDIANVGEENRQIAQYGFWFQRGPEARQETVHPTGPTNPQELNRYGYCLGNPLRYVDPSGEQIEVFVALLAVIVFIEVGVPVIYGLSEEFSDDHHDEPLDTPEPSPPPIPEGTPQGGPPLLPTSTTTPTPIPFFLPPASTPGPSWDAWNPTPTVTRDHSPAEDALHLLHGGIDLQHVEEEGILIPESIYVPEIWIYDPISGQRTPR